MPRVAPVVDGWVTIKVAAGLAQVHESTIRRDVAAELLRKKQKREGCAVYVLRSQVLALYQIQEAG